jgi:hypothetical protein
MAYSVRNTGIPVSSTNKTDCHDITEILLKVVLNTITLPIHLETMNSDGQQFHQYQQSKQSFLT